MSRISFLSVLLRLVTKIGFVNLFVCTVNDFIPSSTLLVRSPLLVVNRPVHYKFYGQSVGIPLLLTRQLSYLDLQSLFDIQPNYFNPQ